MFLYPFYSLSRLCFQLSEKHPYRVYFKMSYIFTDVTYRLELVNVKCHKNIQDGCLHPHCLLKTLLKIYGNTKCGRKVMRLIFYLPKFLFIFKHQCYPLQNSSLGQVRTDRNFVPTLGSSAGSLQPVWSPACQLHSFECFL